ncbi:hypothetical protein FOA52_002721 [Chlamydomonas sp. UWO 241]|nr:hypothetical protein FOA52_002721 [Chlamydomonas sp. UWO 241]
MPQAMRDGGNVSVYQEGEGGRLVRLEEGEGGADASASTSQPTWVGDLRAYKQQQQGGAQEQQRQQRQQDQQQQEQEQQDEQEQRRDDAEVLLEIQEAGRQRPLWASHHWVDPGPPQALPRPGDGTSAIERQMRLQVAACVRHDPRVLDEMRAAAANSVEADNGGSGSGGSGSRAGWGLPSVQGLSQSLASTQGQQGQQAQQGRRRGKGGAAAADAPGGATAGARPVRWGVVGAQATSRGRGRGGGGRMRLAAGDSYDPDDDSNFSSDDPLEGALAATLAQWQKEQDAQRRVLPRGARKATMHVRGREQPGRGGSGGGGGGRVPSSWLPAAPGGFGSGDAAAPVRALQWSLPWVGH